MKTYNMCMKTYFAKVYAKTLQAYLFCCIEVQDCFIANNLTLKTFRFCLILVRFCLTSYS